MSDKDQIEFLRSIIFNVQRMCRRSKTEVLVRGEIEPSEIDNYIEMHKEGPITYKGRPVTPLPEWKTLRRGT